MVQVRPWGICIDDCIFSYQFPKMLHCFLFAFAVLKTLAMCPICHHCKKLYLQIFKVFSSGATWDADECHFRYSLLLISPRLPRQVESIKNKTGWLLSHNLVESSLTALSIESHAFSLFYAQNFKYAFLMQFTKISFI